MCIRARSSSLASIPIRYAMIPNFGMPNSTKARRTKRAVTFCINVVEVFPRPFKMLPMVVTR